MNLYKKLKKLHQNLFYLELIVQKKDRVVTQQFSDYQNYKNLVSQVTKGDPCEKYILNYFSKLYALKDKIFKSQESSLGITEYDINEYLSSPTFLRKNT